MRLYIIYLYHILYITILLNLYTISYALRTTQRLSTTLTPNEFVDYADQLLINKIHSPIFTVQAPSLQSRRAEGKFFLGSIFLSTINSTLSISTSHGSLINCLYYPNAHPLSPITPITKLENPIQIIIDPIMTQTTNEMPFTAQYSPFQTGIYDSAFVSSSSKLYDYFQPNEMTELLSDPNFIQYTSTSSSSLPWHLLDYTLEHINNEMRRNLTLQFTIIPHTTSLAKRLDTIQPYSLGFIQCHDIMIASDLISVRKQLMVHMFNYDRTHNTILYSTQLHLLHNQLQFNYEQRIITTSLNFTINMIDYPNIEHFNRGNLHLRALSILMPPVPINSTSLYPTNEKLTSIILTDVEKKLHKIMTTPKTLGQYLSYLQFQHEIQIELYLPFIKYANSNDFNYDITILHDATIYRDSPFNEHDKAIHDRFSTNIDFILRPQCLTSNVMKPTSTTTNPTTTTSSSTTPKTNNNQSKNDDIPFVYDLSRSTSENIELLESIILNMYQDDDNNNDNDNNNTNNNSNQSNNNNNNNNNNHSTIHNLLHTPTQCNDSVEIGTLGSRTFLLLPSFSPTISSLTFQLSYTMKYIDIIQYISWESIINKLLTPSTLRYYDIFSINGLPTLSQHLDHFDHEHDVYRSYHEFFTWTNYTITYPIHYNQQIVQPLIMNHETNNNHHNYYDNDNNNNNNDDNTLYGFDFQHFNPRQQQYSTSTTTSSSSSTTSSSKQLPTSPIPNTFIQSTLNYQSTPFSKNIPIPDLLIRTLSPSLQTLFYKRMKGLKLSLPQENTLRSIQMFEWGLTIPNSPLCPEITTLDFNPILYQNNNDIEPQPTIFQRTKLILWLDCILSLP